VSFLSNHSPALSSLLLFPVLSCSHKDEPQIRVIINDGVTPLTGIRGCKKDRDGMCDLAAFIKSQQQIVEETDWDWGCEGVWDVPEGSAWETITGDPPSK
jgi:hypothetical protein